MNPPRLISAVATCTSRTKYDATISPAQAAIPVAASPWRAREQEVVAAGGGDFKSAAREVLSADVLKVVVVADGRRDRRFDRACALCLVGLVQGAQRFGQREDGALLRGHAHEDRSTGDGC